MTVTTTAKPKTTVDLFFVTEHRLHHYLPTYPMVMGCIESVRFQAAGLTRILQHHQPWAQLDRGRRSIGWLGTAWLTNTLIRTDL